MNWLHTILVLGVAFLLVFVQGTMNSFRSLLGAQVDFLPGLMVYASLTCGPVTLALLAFLGGLWADSLSANPLGISILPLFCVGLVLQYYRGLILREQLYAQWVLGCAASAFVPVSSLLLLLNADKQPIIGWLSIWQWLVMIVIGGGITPLWFRCFDWLMHSLSYREMDSNSFRPDRQIKRGRM
jgi:hypothetical protein